MAKQKNELADEPVAEIESDELETVQEEIADPPIVEEVPLWVRAEAGESYLSIARRYFPNEAPGLKSPQLVSLNQNRPLKEGVKVFLRKDK